jgi:hypothetical protein
MNGTTQIVTLYLGEEAVRALMADLASTFQVYAPGDDEEVLWFDSTEVYVRFSFTRGCKFTEVDFVSE